MDIHLAADDAGQTVLADVKQNGSAFERKRILQMLREIADSDANKKA